MPALAPPEERSDDDQMDQMMMQQLEDKLMVGSSSQVSLALKDLSYLLLNMHRAT